MFDRVLNTLLISSVEIDHLAFLHIDETKNNLFGWVRSNILRNRLLLLKNKSLNLSDQVLIVRLMCIILMELNYLQDYELG